MKQLLLISSFFVLIGCSSSEQRTQNPEVSSSYTNTKFLKNTPAVRHQLCTRDQFCPVTFTTQDDVTISALFRNNPHARATLICLAGFYPGNKEGLAVFADILPADQYNVLLVDARGHGQSEGNLWWDIAKLGTHEYRDIIAAMEFIHQETNKPIVIYGLCAGAFHALQAITHVKYAYLQVLKIRGLIFDSGWATMCEITHQAVTQDIKRRVPTRLLQTAARWIFNVVYYSWYQSVCERTDKRARLPERIEDVQIPIFYIHAQNDTYSPLESCKILHEKTKHKTEWFLQEARHAYIHLHHSKEFGKKILEFLNAVI